MNINNLTIAELTAKNKTSLLKNYYRNQTKKQHPTLSSLADLMDALLCCRQILLTGNRQNHPQDFLREILIRALKQQIHCRYFTTAQEAKDFIPYYCLRHHNLNLENLKTGNLTQEQLSDPLLRLKIFR